MADNALVTLTTVKNFLRIGKEEVAADMILTEMAEMASETMLDYLHIPLLDVEWAVDDIPGPIKMGILLMVQAMYDGETDVLNQNVKDLVHRFRDPTLA